MLLMGEFEECGVDGFGEVGAAEASGEAEEVGGFGGMRWEWEWKRVEGMVDSGVFVEERGDWRWVGVGEEERFGMEKEK